MEGGKVNVVDGRIAWGVRWRPGGVLVAVGCSIEVGWVKWRVGC